MVHRVLDAGGRHGGVGEVVGEAVERLHGETMVGIDHQNQVLRPDWDLSQPSSERLRLAVLRSGQRYDVKKIRTMPSRRRHQLRRSVIRSVVDQNNATRAAITQR